MPFNAIVPWECQNLPISIQEELNRRKTQRSFNFINNTNDASGWDSSGDWKKYKGPTVAWSRVCSNGLGRAKKGLTMADPTKEGDWDKPGFIFYGGKDFYDSYGFKSINNSPNTQVIGYTPQGIPHTIDNDIQKSNYPIHVPPPEISKVDVTIQKELFRRASIEWTCFSHKQMEYMTPYFLTPGISIIIEYGWNNFNPESLIDLSDNVKLGRMWKNPYHLYTDYVLRSKGNYDVMWGIVTNFHWSIDGSRISCHTEITSKDRIYAGLTSNATSVYIDSESIKDIKKKTPLGGLSEFCESIMGGIKTIAECTTLGDVKEENAKKLVNLCKKMPHESYWRGVFFKDVVKGVENSDFKGDDIWVNMGFIVELMNSLLTKKDSSFFRVDVDFTMIGGHPNLISTNTDVLIPNELAPKYFYSCKETMKSKYIPGDDKQKSWSDQFPGRETKIVSGSVFYLADVALNNIFKQNGESGHPSEGKVNRNDIDQFINYNRYFNKGKVERISYAFPITEETTITLPSGTAVYEPYYYGFFKDLYINVRVFKSIVDGENNLTYVDIYKKIFETLSNASNNFWNFSLIDGSELNPITKNKTFYTTDENVIESMKIVDLNMIPSGNNKNTPAFSFDYFDSDSVIQSIAFKPHLSDKQAARVIFSKMNNNSAPVVISDDNDLLNYEFKDRILAKQTSEELPQSVQSFSEDEYFKVTREDLQSPAPKDGDSMLQLTEKINGVDNIVRLVLPNDKMLQMLLDDDDITRNGKYFGIQPGITAEITLQGIGGVRTFQMFLIKNLPQPYSHKNIIFRIVDVQNSIENGKWTTIIKAGLMPLRGRYIKSKLGIKTQDQ
jgi:hypothetical protein